MASKLFTILLILPAIYAKIEIKIVAFDSEAKSSVHISGTDEDIISDQEQDTFLLNNDTLKNCMAIYYGRKPDHVFIRSPTPWGDLYKKFNWQQVTRILTPRNATILEVGSQPTILQKNEFNNNSSKPATFKTEITQSVENTLTSTWECNHDLTVNQEIEYGIDIKVSSIFGKTSYSYKSAWGEGVSKSESVTVGSTSGVELTLEPYQSVIAELIATRGQMTIEVEYEATLSGSIAVNYNEAYKDHHFWNMAVNTIMGAGGLERTKKSKEVIKLGYYSNSKVIIRDVKDSAVLFSVPMVMI